MTGPEIERLMTLLARLPGLGPRSARRVALHLIQKREAVMAPLIGALSDVADRVRPCGVCGNFDTHDPCGVCQDPRRDETVMCVVEDVADLWAMERAGAFSGRYHVLGGVLSALEGVGPDDLNLPALEARCTAGRIREVVLALGATVDGQTTAHVIADRLGEAAPGITVSSLGQGVPVGGELDFLDDGTIGAALRARRPV
ncbi:recombination protein RecR [Roseospira marina]|uniref:Recombination protein RecR n=1 Tax=Roseospira marina TaxID=140057 RepID=A0A5M6ICF4_9PROT|nr:recombination mediator RecR [Roseospira marina]KAA5605802.1 recombination protein RecR [Roseospira marina]MBB4313617.1 recombination protein RecR [Roseospira marina]MBB5086779.1 recombination protein RecR [Roseospira marina]